MSATADCSSVSASCISLLVSGMPLRILPEMAGSGLLGKCWWAGVGVGGEAGSSGAGPVTYFSYWIPCFGYRSDRLWHVVYLLGDYGYGACLIAQFVMIVRKNGLRAVTSRSENYCTSRGAFPLRCSFFRQEKI